MASQVAAHWGHASWVGVGRQSNEDRFAVEPAETLAQRLHRGTLWVVADGIGADGRGALAAQQAADEIAAHYGGARASDASHSLREAFDAANALLFAANDPALPSANRVGATASAVALLGDQLVIGHVGRGRVYLLRGGQLQQLTEDHIWANEQRRRGQMSAAEIAAHPSRNLLTHALGIRARVHVDQVRVQLQPGDVVLLCSDGVHRAVGDFEIMGLLQLPADECFRGLQQRAQAATQTDDGTAIVIRCVAGPPERLHDERLWSIRELPATDLAGVVTSLLATVREVSGAERAALVLCSGDGAQQVTWADGEDHACATHADRMPQFVERAMAERAQHISTWVDDVGGAGIAASMAVVAGDRVLGALYIEAAGERAVHVRDVLEGAAPAAASTLDTALAFAALTERLRELEVNMRRQESLVRSLSSALVALDTAGRIIQWNPAAMDLFGVEPSQALQQRLSEVLPRQLVNWLSGLIIEAEASDRSLVIGNEWEGSIGRRSRVVLAGRVARIRDEEVGGHVFIVNDRTDITLVEEAHRREQERYASQRALFRRYLAPAVVERALQSPESVRLGGARQPVTILFADVRGFTGFSESRPPEEVVDVLNAYLGLATGAIFDHLGTLDKFIGDGVMAIFGAPMTQEEHALAALRAALTIRDRVLELRRAGGGSFSFGIGINTGESVVGNIGTAELMNYTAIGDVVNVANRLEAEARAGEVLISQATLDAIPLTLDVEELGPMYLPGRAVPVVTYKVLHLRERAPG